MCQITQVHDSVEESIVSWKGSDRSERARDETSKVLIDCIPGRVLIDQKEREMKQVK